MVSDFIQKHATFLRILLIITGITYYLASTLHAHAAVLPPPAGKGVPEMQVASLIASLDAVTAKPGKGKKKPFTIVIDAGHGGKDSGAVGSRSKEKDITLSLALRMGEMIEKQYPDVQVLLTRNVDVFIPLFRRIQYANEQSADLFVSIHCNFIENPKTRGTETFVMGLHRAEDNLEVAKRENASILLEQNYLENYEGFDPNSAEGHIMFSMYQNNYLDKSIAFAATVESQFAGMKVSKSRGVKQAGFAVLRRASMPAVLVEAGFLSNETEETFLLSDEGQHAVVSSLVKAFGTFYEENQKEEILVAATDASPSDKGVLGGNNSITSGQVSSSVAPVPGPTSSATASSETPGTVTQVSGPVFQVQIAAVRNDKVDMNTEELRSIGTLIVKKQGDVTKYLVGDFITRGSAEIAREKLKNIGYTGAFLVMADSVTR